MLMRCKLYSRQGAVRLHPLGGMMHVEKWAKYWSRCCYPPLAAFLVIQKMVSLLSCPCSWCTSQHRGTIYVEIVHTSIVPPSGCNMTAFCREYNLHLINIPSIAGVWKGLYDIIYDFIWYHTWFLYVGQFFICESHMVNPSYVYQ